MKDVGQITYELLQRKSDFRATFETEAGKRVLAYLMKISGIPKTATSADAQQLLIQEGQQHIVYSILKILNTDQQELLNRIEEQYED